jgi:hypothetical protein
MRKHYPIEIVALDSTASQAIDLAEPIRFDKTIKTDAKHFSENITLGHRQILLLSKRKNLTGSRKMKLCYNQQIFYREVQYAKGRQLEAGRYK